MPTEPFEPCPFCGGHGMTRSELRGGCSDGAHALGRSFRVNAGKRANEIGLPGTFDEVFVVDRGRKKLSYRLTEASLALARGLLAQVRASLTHPLDFGAVVEKHQTTPKAARNSAC